MPDDVEGMAKVRGAPSFIGADLGPAGDANGTVLFKALGYDLVK